MSGWQPIETAPLDGTPVLLRGGEVHSHEDVLPVVIGFYNRLSWCNYASWAYAYWDGDWRSEYIGPTEWHPIPE